MMSSCLPICGERNCHVLGKGCVCPETNQNRSGSYGHQLPSIFVVVVLNGEVCMAWES